MKWRIEEVQAYLEDRIKFNEASDKEIEFYNLLTYGVGINKSNIHILRWLERKMNKEFNGGN